jgi:hypothetical protein
MNDLLSNNFTEEINIPIIQKNLRLQKLALGGVALSVSLSSIYWITIYRRQEVDDASQLAWFFKIYPAISVLTNALSFNNYLLVVKSHTLINTSLKKRDAALFNQGYVSFYKSGVLSIIILIISILSFVPYLITM